MYINMVAVMPIKTSALRTDAMRIMYTISAGIRAAGPSARKATMLPANIYR